MAPKIVSPSKQSFILMVFNCDNDLAYTDPPSDWAAVDAIIEILAGNGGDDDCEDAKCLQDRPNKMEETGFVAVLFSSVPRVKQLLMASDELQHHLISHQHGLQKALQSQ